MSNAPFQALLMVNSGADILACTQDDYWDNTVLLLHFDGVNNGTIFVDSGPKSKDLVVAGSVITRTDIYKFGQSADFGSSGGGIATNVGTDDFAFGTGDFTVELWIRTTNLAPQYVLDNLVLGDGGTWALIINAAGDGTVGWWTGAGAGTLVASSTTTPADQGWVHIAVVRESGALGIYVNGTLEAAVADATDYTDTVPYFLIANQRGGTGVTNFDGQMDELRITKGVARYTGASFDLATLPFCNFQGDGGGGGGCVVDQYYSCGPENDPYWDNVILQMHFDGADGSTTFVDDSLLARTLVPSGTVELDTDVAKFGTASGRFPDSGNPYISAGDGWDLTGDFTIEFWWRPTDTTTAGQVLLSVNGGSAGNWFYIVQQNNTVTGNIGWAIGTATSSPATFPIIAGVWYHVAVVRNAGSVSTYIDGSLYAGPTTATYVPSSTRVLQVGYDAAVGNAIRGNLDDIRITKGVARYTGNFNIPTEAFPDAQENYTPAPELPYNTGFIEDVTAVGLPTRVAITSVSPTIRALSMGTTTVYEWDTQLNYIGTDTATGSVETNFPGPVSGSNCPVGVIGSTPIRVILSNQTIASGDIVTVGAKNAGDAYSAELTSVLPTDEKVAGIALAAGGTDAVIVTCPGASNIAENTADKYYVVRWNGSAVSLVESGTTDDPLSIYDFGHGSVGYYHYAGNSASPDATKIVVAYGPANSMSQYSIRSGVMYSDFLPVSLGAGGFYYASPLWASDSRLIVRAGTRLLRSYIAWDLARTILSLHAEDTTDSSCYQPKTVTLLGGAVVSTDQFKFGTSSFYIPHTGSVASHGLSIEDHMDFDFGTLDWSLELWAYSESNDHTGYLYHFSFVNGCYATVGTNGLLNVRWGWHNSYVSRSNLISVPTGQWNHFLFCRRGNALETFFNGALIDTVAVVASARFNSTGPFYIGRATNDSTYSWGGYIDEINVVRGAARYDPAGFTPATLEWCDSAGSGSEIPTSGRAPLTGISMSAETGGVNQTDWFAALTGQQMTAGQGGLTPPGTAYNLPIGVNATYTSSRALASSSATTIAVEVNIDFRYRGDVYFKIVAGTEHTFGWLAPVDYSGSVISAAHCQYEIQFTRLDSSTFVEGSNTFTPGTWYTGSNIEAKYLTYTTSFVLAASDTSASQQLSLRIQVRPTVASGLSGAAYERDYVLNFVGLVTKPASAGSTYPDLQDSSHTLSNTSTYYVDFKSDGTVRSHTGATIGRWIDADPLLPGIANQFKLQVSADPIPAGYTRVSNTLINAYIESNLSTTNRFDFSLIAPSEVLSDSYRAFTVRAVPLLSNPRYGESGYYSIHTFAIFSPNLGGGV